MLDMRVRATRDVRANLKVSPVKDMFFLKEVPLCKEVFFMVGGFIVLKKKWLLLIPIADWPWITHLTSQPLAWFLVPELLRNKTKIWLGIGTHTSGGKYREHDHPISLHSVLMSLFSSQHSGSVKNMQEHSAPSLKLGLSGMLFGIGTSSSSIIFIFI